MERAGSEIGGVTAGSEAMASDLAESEVAEGYLRRFLENPGNEAPWDFSKNVCTIYLETPLSDGERVLAEDILRQLARSLELKVRQTITQQLKDSPILPHDIALQLAEDVESVALPILEFSEVLTDEDLIAIIQNRGAAQQTAIAQRKTVPPPVSEALVATAGEGPVAALLLNIGAQIDALTYDEVVTLFPENEAVLGAMAVRPELPIEVAGKLIELVSDHLQFELASRYAASANVIERLLAQGSEGATIAVLAHYEALSDAEILAAQLHGCDRLTPSLLLRAVYYGQLDFFEFGLARRAQINLEEVRTHVAAATAPGFQRLFRRAQLPAVLFQLCRNVLEDLAEEIALFDAEPAESDTRRIISAMARRRDFDRGKFESVMLEIA
jgi:uncharacterized protein (DUF2336 family)